MLIREISEVRTMLAPTFPHRTGPPNSRKPSRLAGGRLAVCELAGGEYYCFHR